MQITISPGHSQIHSYYGRSIGNQYGLWNSTTTVQGHSKNTAHIKMILARDKGARVWCHIQDLYLKVSFAFFGVKKVGKPSFYITTYAPQFVALHLLFSGVRFF